MDPRIQSQKELQNSGFVQETLQRNFFFRNLKKICGNRISEDFAIDKQKPLRTQFQGRPLSTASWSKENEQEKQSKNETSTLIFIWTWFLCCAVLKIFKIQLVKKPTLEWIFYPVWLLHFHILRRNSSLCCKWNL